MLGRPMYDTVQIFCKINRAVEAGTHCKCFGSLFPGATMGCCVSDERFLAIEIITIIFVDAIVPTKLLRVLSQARLFQFSEKL